MTFDENEVNRDGGGRFDKKHGLTADITLPVASEQVPVTIEFDQWSGQPYASEYSAVAQDYDLRPVLDTFSTEDLREFVENPQDADEVFWRAVNSGLVDEKAAQHGFEVRLDGIREYIRQREAAGQEDALTEEVVLDAKRRADVYHRYAVEGASAMAGMEGNGFTANLWRDGKRVMLVENQGNGGANVYTDISDAKTPTRHRGPEIERFQKAASEMYGPNRFESDDALVTFISWASEVDKAAQKNGWSRDEVVESVVQDYRQEMERNYVEADETEIAALRDPSIISRLVD